MSIGIFRADEAYAVKAALQRAFGAKAFRGEPVPQDPNDELAEVLLEIIRKEREDAQKKEDTTKTKRVAETSKGRKGKSAIGARI